MFDSRSREEQRQAHHRLATSNDLGAESNPDTGLVLHRGLCGSGTIEFSYDPTTHEVVNGELREKESY
ncbi:MAG: hypothetical protein K1X83_03665 [Oligoflexia bacterium]|nr:hypothetical protein [Oligoflexia bacterium]